jgi:hypothetical protein
VRFTTVEISHDEILALYRAAEHRPTSAPIETVREVPIITVKEVLPKEVLTLLDDAERALDPNEDFNDAERVRVKIDAFLSARKKR